MKRLYSLVTISIGCSSLGLDNKQIAERINEAYDGVSGFVIDAQEAEVINKNGSSVYGEISPEGVELLKPHLHLTKEDVFYDLGSGRGCMVFYLFGTTDIKKAVGVELSGTRHNLAMKAKDFLKCYSNFDEQKNRSLEFYNQDMFQAPKNDATVIYVSSTCFSADFMKKLAEDLAKLKKGLRLITLTRLPEGHAFTLKKKLSISMSWSPEGTTTYIYEL